MSDGHGSDTHLEPFLHIRGRGFALKERTETDIIYHTVETMSVAGYALDMLLVYSPEEGWHAGLLLNRNPFAFFEGTFPSSENAVVIAQTFLDEAQNVQNLMHIREQQPEQHILTIQVDVPKKRRWLNFWKR
jgi:hypothetical protein